jgi:hypothetical protein
MFNLPIHAPLAGKEYRDKHRKKMIAEIRDGILSKGSSDFGKLSKLGAQAKVEHSKRTKRQYIHKRKKGIDSLYSKWSSSVKAAKLGDDSLVREYKKAIEERKQKRLEDFKALKLHTTLEVSELTSTNRRNAVYWAKRNGVVIYRAFNTYGWTNKNIECYKKHIERIKKQKDEHKKERVSESRRKRWRDTGIWTTAEVAKKLGVSYDAVRRKVYKFNVDFYPPPISAFGWQEEQIKALKKYIREIKK